MLEWVDSRPTSKNGKLGGGETCSKMSKLMRGPRQWLTPGPLFCAELASPMWTAASKSKELTHQRSPTNPRFTDVSAFFVRNPPPQIFCLYDIPPKRPLSKRLLKVRPDNVDLKLTLEIFEDVRVLQILT